MSTWIQSVQYSRKFVQIGTLFWITLRKCVIFSFFCNIWSNTSLLFYHFVNWKMRQNGKDMFKLIPLILYFENVPEVVLIFVRSWKMRPLPIILFFWDILTNVSSLIHYLWYRCHGCLLPMWRIFTLKSTKEPKP